MTTRPQLAATEATGNAKHQAALAAQAEQLVSLRAEIADTLVILVGLADQLEALTDSRQRVRARLVTEETRQIFEKQTRLDRAAARGLVGRIEDPGLTWMNTAARIGTGQVQAPVQTMPALSVVAEIRYTLRHHLRRLGRPAKLALLELEQTAEEDHGYCPWPRNPILTAAVDVDDQGVTHLAARLLRLVEAYTNRKDLDAVKRDLDRLEEAALDVTEGMAGKSSLPIGSETCPWCGRNTLVLLSRVPGVNALVVRCEGTHRCECTWEFCDCHRNPRKNRHEWINSGLQPDGTKVRAATNTLITLANLQNKRKELTILETKALDAIAVIRVMHQPVNYQPWSTDCAAAADHEKREQWVEAENGAGQPGDLICMACEPVAVVCTSCHEDDGSDVAWPCPTALACDIDGELAALIADDTTTTTTTD